MEVSLLAVPEAGLGAPNVLFEANAVHRSQFGGFRSVKLLPDNYLLFASLAESHAEIRTKNRGEGGSRSPEPAIFAEGDLYTLSFDEVRLHDGNGSREVARLPTGMVRRTTTPMVIDDTDPPGFDVGVYGDFGPRILSYADGIVTSRTEPEVVASLARTDDGLLLVCGLTGTRIDGTEISWTYPALPWSPAGPEETIRYRPMFGRDRLGYFGAVASAGALRLLQPDGTVVSLGSDLPRSGIPGETDVATEFDRLNLVTAVDDLDGDGVLEAVVVSMNLVWAFHRTGAVFDGFPITLHAEAGPGAPLVTRMSASGGKTILVGLVDGTIEAFDLGNGGRRLPGFPLVGGHGVMYTPAVAADRIGALDADGVFRVWNLEAPAEPAMSLVSAGNSSFVVVDPGSEPGAAEFLLDPSETYNWPNPVQDGRTWIRFRLSEPADVTVRIIDLAGRFIEELEHPSAPAGTPIEIGWAANVESGVYVARVHAQTAGGRSEDRLVKIAVIR